jgi:Flp pilus assembly protein TadG
MKLGNDEILTVALDLATDAESPAIYLGDVYMCAIQIIFTGSPTGTFSLQASCDPGNSNATTESQRSASVVNWTDVTGSNQAVTSDGNHMWRLDVVAYRWVKVKYESTSGTGSLTSVRINTKG